MAAPLTATEALKAWLDHLEHEKRASPRTLEAYDGCVQAYVSFLERHRGETIALADLGEVSAAELRAYLANRRAGRHPFSPRSLSQALSAVRSFHRFLDRRLATPNGAVALVRGPKIRPGSPRPVSEGQARALIAEAPEDGAPAWRGVRDQAVLTLLWGCGLRISEALALERRDAPLPQSLRVLGKGGKTRLVPVLSVVREQIERYSKLIPFPLGADDALFRADRGGPLRPRQVQGLVQRLRGRLGLWRTRAPHTRCVTPSPPTFSERART